MTIGLGQLITADDINRLITDANGKLARDLTNLDSSLSTTEKESILEKLGITVGTNSVTITINGTTYTGGSS